MATSPGLVVALVVVAALAGLAGGRLLSGGSGADDPPSPPDTASEQARQVQQLLDQSRRDRDLAGRAIRSIEGCQRSAAIADLKKARDGRDRGLKLAEGLRVDKLPRGAELQAAIKEAMRLSRDANTAHLQWAEAMRCRSRIKCDTACEQHKTKADELAGKATTAKRRVVELWNPIAHTKLSEKKI